MGVTSGKRRTAREMAVQMLYQSDVGGSELPQIFRNFDVGGLRDAEAEDEGDERSTGAGGESKSSSVAGHGVATTRTAVTPGARAAVGRRRKQLEEAFEYARRLVRGTLEHRQRIDELIAEQADNWRLERMPVVDRNVLRLAVYELLFELDIPKLVVVDEAIELAKRFGSENSSRFVNGLLDGLLKKHSFPGRMS